MGTEHVGTGWHYPFRVDPDGGFAMTGGTAKLEQSMRLILATYPGERLVRPDFGSRLRDYVFAPTTGDTTAELAAEVHRALRQWEPRVDVDDVTARPAPDVPGLLQVDVRYTVKATNDTRNLVFPFYTIPDDGQE
jgi:uncharacterized protein